MNKNEPDSVARNIKKYRLLNKMTQEERDSIPTEFQCSLFDDLTIQVADIFDRVV